MFNMNPSYSAFAILKASRHNWILWNIFSSLTQLRIFATWSVNLCIVARTRLVILSTFQDKLSKTSKMGFGEADLNIHPIIANLIDCPILYDIEKGCFCPNPKFDIELFPALRAKKLGRLPWKWYTGNGVQFLIFLYVTIHLWQLVTTADLGIATDGAKTIPIEQLEEITAYVLAFAGTVVILLASYTVQVHRIDFVNFLNFIYDRFGIKYRG